MMDILQQGAGNGGDLAVLSGDIARADLLLQQVMIALFGGNTEASTLGNEITGEIRLDWWGNSLLQPDDKQLQLNSQTERALRENPLTSVGRINITRAIESDLQYLKPVANIKVDVRIAGTDRLAITVGLTLPESTTKYVSAIWDATKQELILEQAI